MLSKISPIRLAGSGPPAQTTHFAYPADEGAPPVEGALERAAARFGRRYGV